jgi:hypothetical protein
MRRANMPDSRFDCFCSDCLGAGANLESGPLISQSHPKLTASELPGGNGQEAKWEADWIDLGGEG